VSLPGWNWKQIGAYIVGGLSALAAIWNSWGIKGLQVKTDGLFEWRSRADRAEAKLEEKNDARDRADKKDADKKDADKKDADK
jgi:hypothetical protein